MNSQIARDDIDHNGELLRILSDAIFDYYNDDDAESYRQTVTDFAFGDFNYLAYISIRDLRDSDDPASDLYENYTDLFPYEQTALICSLAQRFSTLYNEV